MTIDIKGIDRDKLLYHLWLNQKSTSLFAFVASYDADAAKQSADYRGYVDYACGRAIKTTIFGSDEINPRLYDRDAGSGTFQRVVDQLRAES
jgi:hypothetical protein